MDESWLGLPEKLFWGEGVDRQNANNVCHERHSKQMTGTGDQKYPHVGDAMIKKIHVGT